MIFTVKEVHWISDIQNIVFLALRVKKRKRNETAFLTVESGVHVNTKVFAFDSEVTLRTMSFAINCQFKNNKVTWCWATMYN